MLRDLIISDLNGTFHMMKLKIAASTLALLAFFLPAPSEAQTAIPVEKASDIVKPLYDALTASSPDQVRARLEMGTSSNWQNCGLNDICETRDETIKRWSKRISVVPDFRLMVLDVLTSGNKIIVRSEATGSPFGVFMGINVHGRSFKLMTIDIHEVKNGKIVRTFHVEDWSRALRQLRG